MAIFKTPKAICKRKACGHTWTPRQSDVRVCPKCHSVRWDQEEDLSLSVQKRIAAQKEEEV